MTWTPPTEVRRLAIIGTGLVGTSVAMAATRAGLEVEGWDLDRTTLDAAAATGALRGGPSIREVASKADLVVVATPIATVASTVIAALAAAPEAVVTDVASVKGGVVATVTASAPHDLPRFVPGHPMGGSERSGPAHASAHVIDSIVWVLTPVERTDPRAFALVEGVVQAIGARPVTLSPERHDRLVAFVSHLPQVASTALMGLAATEEADEPDLLLLAAGGFRDLTRLAASNPALWREILSANRDEIAAAIDLYVDQLGSLRDAIATDAPVVEQRFADAKAARLRLAAKPQVRAGVAVLQVQIPDEPGALARITATLGAGEVNIEDLQIVHSPEGGRGMVYLTVAAPAAWSALNVLTDAGYDPIRLA